MVFFTGEEEKDMETIRNSYQWIKPYDTKLKEAEKVFKLYQYLLIDKII